MNKSFVNIDIFEKGINMSFEILSFKVRGFRNISYSKIILNRVTSIIGLNGYGKSNLISAIDFGIDFINASSNKKESLMSYNKCIPLLKCNAGMDYSFEIEALSDKEFFIYGYTFEWNTKQNNNHPRIKEEHLFIKPRSSTSKYSTYILRNDKGTKYKSSETGRCANTIQIENNELVINKLRNYDKLFFLETIKQLNSIEFYVEKHLDTKSSYMPDPLVIKDSTELNSILNIPRKIWEIKNRYPNQYEILINTFMQLFPTIKQIECQEHKIEFENPIELSDDADIIFSECVYNMIIKDEKMTQTISFDNLSDGTKRVFLSLTFALLANIRNLPVIVFEEPENSIHPSLLQPYLRALDRLSGNSKIILTSHSPYMIQYMPTEDIYIGLKCESGQVDFRRIVKADALNKRAEKEEQSVGDLIFNYISFVNANELLQGFVEKQAEEIISEKNDNDDDDNWLLEFLDEK